jgi:hypothetical protein
MSLQSHPASKGAGPSGAGGQSVALQGLAASNAACRAGPPARTALAGKNLGLLCDDPALEEALLAYRAAADLGAHVSLVRPRFTGEQELRAVPETAHMLGRLYDVIACVALPALLVEALRSGAGVPVVSDLDIDARLRAAGTEATAIGPSLVAAAGERLAQWENALASSVA